MKDKTYGLWRAAVAALALLLGACTGAPSVAEIREDVPDQTVDLLLAAHGSARTASSGETFSTLSAPFGSSANSADAPAPDEASVNAELERLRTYLRDRVFTERHFEEVSGGMAIFLLTDTVCSDGTSFPDPVCVAFMDEVEVRLGVERAAKDGLSISVMVGKSRVAPLTYEVSKQRLAIQVALGALHDAAREFGPSGHVLAAALPDILTGRIQSSLERLDPEARSFVTAFSVLEDVRIESGFGRNRVTFSTGTADPLVSVGVNSETHAVQVRLALAATQLELPYGQVVPGGIAGTRFGVRVAGASATLEGADGAPIILKELSFGGGAATVKLDDLTLFSASLNEGLGHVATLSAERRADGITDLTVNPGLDLLLGFGLAPIAGEVVVPDALLDSAFRLAFTSETELPLLRAFAANWGTGASGYVQIINGTLRLEHVGNGSIAANAGQCVSSVTPAEGEDPVLASFAISDCG